jgi:hypothetical protein
MTQTNKKRSEGPDAGLTRCVFNVQQRLPSMPQRSSGGVCVWGGCLAVAVFGKQLMGQQGA